VPCLRIISQDPLTINSPKFCGGERRRPGASRRGRGHDFLAKDADLKTRMAADVLCATAIFRSARC
jgi:hypothetical protein